MKETVKMKKRERSLRRIVAGAVLFTMLTGLLPGQAPIVKADSGTDNKYTQGVTTLGVSGISDPKVPEHDKNPWIGDYVYYGGHLFRVLDKDTTEFSADDGILPQKHTMLLDSDSVIGDVLIGSTVGHVHFDNDAKPNEGAERAGEWEYSDLKAWMNDRNDGFLRQFSEAEIRGIASSTKPAPVEDDGVGFFNVSYAPLKDDKVFALDAVEASREDYGYSPASKNYGDTTDALNRVKASDYGSYHTCSFCEQVEYSGNWWLRSSFYSPRYPQYAGFVFGVSATSEWDYNDGGYFVTNMVSYSDVGPSPALNVDLDSVLLSTVVEDNGSGISESGSPVYGRKFKLTLISDGLETAITRGQNITINGSTVTVPFTVTDKDPYDGIDADRVSVLVVRGDRKSGAIKKHEGLLLSSSLTFKDGTASGEGTFNLPNGYNPTTDHIYIFAEDAKNDDRTTDYASAPVALMQPEAVSGLEYNRYPQELIKNDMGTIPSGYSMVYAVSESEPAEGSYSSDIPTARDAGTYRVWYKVTDNGSNTFGPNSMTVSIAKKRVRVSGVTASDKVYDGTCNVTLSGGAPSSADIISGDTVMIDSLEGRFKYADAGENKPVTVTKITLDGASEDNYAAYADQNSLSANVTPKPVKVTGITVYDKTYDGTATGSIKLKNNSIGTVGDAQIEGIVEKDKFSDNNLTVSRKTTAQFEDAEPGENKEAKLDIKLGGYCSPNYTVSEASQKTAIATITPYTITVKAKDQSVGLNGTVDSHVDKISLVACSLIEGHRISSVTLTSSATDTVTISGVINVGQIVITDADGNDVTSGYNIIREDGVLTVSDDLMVVTAPDVTAVYDGEAHGAAVTVTTPGSGATVKYGETEGTYNLDAAPMITNVSDSPKKVYFKVTADGYKDYTGSATVTITPKPVVVSGITAKNKTYDGKTDAELDFSGVKFNGETINGLTVTATGEFTDANVGTDKTVNISSIALDGTAKDNYALSDSGQQTATKADITKAEIPADSITVPEMIENLTYTASANALVTEGSVTGDIGTMWYALTDGTVTVAPEFDGDSQSADKKWSTSVPKAVDAGSYNVWYRIMGDEHHKDTAAAKISVTIGKAVVTAPVIAPKTYNAKPQTAAVTESAFYRVSANDGGTNADNYDVVLTLTDADNYRWTDSEEAVKTLTFAITKANAQVIDDITVARNMTDTDLFRASVAGKMPADAGTLSYNVLASEIGTTGTVQVSEVSVNKNDGTVTAVFTGGKAGDTVTIPVDIYSTNYQDSGVRIVVTIDDYRTVVEIPAAVTGLRWTGEEQTGVLPGDGYTITGNTGTAAGNYTATASLTDSDTHVWSDGTTEDKAISWSIGKAVGPDAPAGLIGIAPVSLSGKDGRITGVTSDMEYSADPGSASWTACTGAEITGLTAGTYYVRLKETATHEAGKALAVTVPENKPGPVVLELDLPGLPGADGKDVRLSVAKSTALIYYDGKKHVVKDTFVYQDPDGNGYTVEGPGLKDSQKKTTSANILLTVEGLTPMYKVSYVYKNNKTASVDKPYFYLKLALDKKSELYKALGKKEKSAVSKALSKANKELKKEGSRIKFEILKRDISSFTHDPDRDTRGKNVVFRDEEGNLLTVNLSFTTKKGVTTAKIKNVKLSYLNRLEKTPYKVITEGKKQIARSIVNNGDGSYTISLEGCTTGKTPNYTGVLTYTGQ